MDRDRQRVFESLVYPFLFVSFLWIVHFFESYMQVDLSRFGILPRTLPGVIGIFTSPFLHGNASHLLSNTLPLLILGIIIIYFYRRVAFTVFAWIYLMTGIWVWIAASGSGYHIGASGLVYGAGSFLFFSGLFRRDRKSLGLSLLVTLIYGGMVWGIFPIFQNVSWETHLFGALTGVFCAWYYRSSGRESRKQQWHEEHENDVEGQEHNLSGNNAYELGQIRSPFNGQTNSLYSPVNITYTKKDDAGRGNR